MLFTKAILLRTIVVVKGILLGAVEFYLVEPPIRHGEKMRVLKACRKVATLALTLSLCAATSILLLPKFGIRSTATMRLFIFHNFDLHFCLVICPFYLIALSCFSEVLVLAFVQILAYKNHYP